MGGVRAIAEPAARSKRLLNDATWSKRSAPAKCFGNSSSVTLTLCYWKLRVVARGDCIERGDEPRFTRSIFHHTAFLAKLLEWILGRALGGLNWGPGLAEKTLLVFAHGDEAVAFANARLPHLVTGVGKINATLELSRAILTAGIETIDRVVVLGTAGGITAEARLDTVYQITAAVQHDFSLPSPMIELVGGGDAELVAAPAVIATGDVFVQDDAQRAVIAAAGATLVDMETYAYAQVCNRLGVPLQVFKTPSDFADSSTTMGEWDGIVVSKSEQLMNFAKDRLPWLVS